MNILNRFKTDIFGILWLCFSIFLALSLFTYNPQDPSFNTAGVNMEVKNACGYIGSFLSDLLYQVFGYSSWLIVLLMFQKTYFQFIGKKSKNYRLQSLMLATFLITTSSLLSLYFPETKIFENHILIGGIVGEVFSQALMTAANFYGAGLILWSFAIVLTVFFTEMSVSDLLARVYEYCKMGVAYLSSFISLKPIIAAFKKISFKRQRPAEAMGTSGSLEGRRFFMLDSNEKKKPLFKFKESSEFEEDYEEEDEEDFEEDDDSIIAYEEEDDGQMAMFPKKTKKRKVKLKARVKRHVEHWELPKLSLIEDPPATRNTVDEKEIKRKSDLLVDKLSQFNVGGEVVGIKPGPAVTMFEFKPNADVKISKITDLADDLCLALSSESVRIIAPIPGRDVVGIETSNSHQETVYLKDIVAEENFWGEEIQLPIPLGRQANGVPKIVDLRKMPHMMVAGTTGSGKSVFVVSTLIGLLFKHSPKTLRLILVDPKQVDLAIFSNIPHLMMPPIREPKKAVVALRWAVREMEKRYRSMAKFGARGLDGFNEKVQNLSKEDVEKHAAYNEELEENNKKTETYYYTEQPFIVIVIEEFGDLMAVDKQNVEHGVVRLAQMARACGMHLILAMQSPRKDVVTGLIKTNIPGRASFKVASKLDSRVILDESGAERLLARGDMLFLAPGMSKPGRHHGAWLSEKDIDKIIKFWSSQGEPEYDALALKALEGSGGGMDLDGIEGGGEFGDEEEYDEKYDEIVSWASGQKTVSASLIQRRFRLGYPRAARIVEIMESEGVIGPANGSKPREVLVNNLKEI